MCVQVLCQLSNASRNNSPHRTLLTTYLVALHAMLGKFGLVASCAVEVFPLREEASSPDDLLAVAAGEAVFVPDGPLVLHVLISCGVGRNNWIAPLSVFCRVCIHSAPTLGPPEVRECRPCSYWPHASDEPTCEGFSTVAYLWVCQPRSVGEGTPAVVFEEYMPESPLPLPCPLWT